MLLYNKNLITDLVGFNLKPLVVRINPVASQLSYLCVTTWRLCFEPDPNAEDAYPYNSKKYQQPYNV